MFEVIQRFGITERRREILSGLLSYQRALIAAGFVNGFQWLDGSFCKDIETIAGRAPRDVDVVTLAYRPIDKSNTVAFADFIDERDDIFDADAVKEAYKVDGYLIDLNAMPHLIVSNTVYWYGLFSHQRETSLWKGMLQIPLNDPDTDEVASMLL